MEVLTHAPAAVRPARGYDFIAITDHFRAEYGFPLTDTRALQTATFTTLLGAELHAPRTGFSAKWHIIVRPPAHDPTHEPRRAYRGTTHHPDSHAG